VPTPSPPDAAAIAVALSRPAIADAAVDAPRPAAPPPPPGATADADGQPQPPPARTDVAPFAYVPPDWDFEDPPPRRLGIEPKDVLIAEAELSNLGLFRLETRPAPGGFAVVVRHARPQDAERLQALAEAVRAEAARYGVRARIRFDFDPILLPTR